ncbi:hypothetical protein ACFC4S_30455 [Priestia megaterium]|uniref:hypothetical protein n=1 Tax=Priestia megaterium TaxID=1404 RepID=UPI001D316823|nr:hypothetical protein [Priestia megaterium]
MYYEHHGILSSISKQGETKKLKQNEPNIKVKELQNNNENLESHNKEVLVKTLR